MLSRGWSDFATPAEVDAETAKAIGRLESAGLPFDALAEGAARTFLQVWTRAIPCHAPPENLCNGVTLAHTVKVRALGTLRASAFEHEMRHRLLEHATGNADAAHAGEVWR